MFYQILPSRPEAHIFTLVCRISEPDASGQLVSLPAWIPGSYMMREFAKNVVCLQARCDGRTLAVSRVDKSTWRVEPCQGELEISYDVYAWDLSVRAAHLDTNHAYFNGSSVFLQVHGKEGEECLVEIQRPEGSAYRSWRVATSMQRQEAALYGFGLYRADNYDDLIDHPVELAEFEPATFDVNGTPHDLVFSGRCDADIERICRDLKPICEQHAALFGELPEEVERYLFMTMVVGDGYGGLEHRSSTSLICSRSDLPVTGQQEISDGYLNFLGLCSHEYFHTWNVKRIKPAAFLPYDLSREAYTRQLWAFEGITSYYDDLALVRSGTIAPQRYLDLVAKTVTRVVRGSGRLKQSVADSSFDAWTKFYRQDENAPNAIVSYYTKGSLIALALDLTLRSVTDGRRSLDDLMRRLWREYGKPLVGVPEGRIELMAAEVAGQEMGEFFARFLYGTEDLPLAELLKSVAVDYLLRPAESPSDMGGSVSNRSPEELLARADLGVRVVAEGGAAKIANVFDGGAAQRAGLSAGDILVAIDALKVTAQSWAEHLQRCQVGQTIEIFAFRRDELMRFQVTLQAPPLDTCELRLQEGVADELLRRRNAWLHCQ